jgi:hypothetical protein
MKRAVCFFSLLLIVTFLFHDAFACRYTIREIGFSDVYSKNYQLLIFTNSITSKEEILTIRQFSNMLLRDSNVTLDLVNIDEQNSSPNLKFLSQYNPHTFPFAVFVSPEGKSMLCSYTTTDRLFSDSSFPLFESLVSSSARDEIIKKLIRSYGVVLIIEGTDDAENRRVKNAAKEAVKAITGSMEQMPKVVNEPPEIMAVPHNKVNDENILLFGLGITEKNKDDTHVAIIYGRGKLAGPVLMDEQINTKRIYNLLTLVGADCECGIDNSWIIGDVIPLRWGPSEQAELTKHLGFDVENPFIKTEMSQIISLKPSAVNQINPLEENLLGFVEESFEIVNKDDAVPKITAAEIRKSFSQENQPEINLMLKKTFIGLGVIFLIIVITGLSIFLLHKRRTTKN